MRALPFLLLAACTSDVPDAPTWAEHVQPILEANCVQCHGAPAIGGAPTGFRLDRLDDTEGPLEPIQGAGSMAERIVERVVAGTMPPGEPLWLDQVETIERWFAQGAPRGARPDNAPPSITLLDGAPALPDAILLPYEIRDPDFEMVHGELLADGVVVDDSLRAGRGQAGFSTATFAAGELALSARLVDGTGEVTVELGSFAVPREGSAPPRLRVASPRRFDILDDLTEVELTVTDLDSPEPVTVTLAANGEEIARFDVTPGVPALYGWDTTSLPPSELTTLSISLSTGGGTTIDRLIASDVTTDEDRESILAIFAARCDGCHSDLELVRGRRAVLYQRVVKQANMPPAPHATNFTDEDRARFAEWLLAGAP